MPHLTAAKITGARVIYEPYDVGALAPMTHDYGHAFQACTTDYQAPQTIIARRMKCTDQKRQVDSSGGGVKWVTYEKYELASPNDSFLLYVGGNTDNLWSADHSAAKATFQHAENTYNMYYSFAFMASIQTNDEQHKHVHPIFCTMLIPCTLHTIAADAFNLNLPDSLGFVRPDEFPPLPDDLTYKSFFDTYRPYILATNFTKECKLTDADWNEIKTRLSSIVGTFDVNRIHNSFGPVQVIQSEKVKIDKRVGVTTEKGTLTLQMVLPTYGMLSGNSPGNSINLMHECLHNIMVIIKAKIGDDKYQKIMASTGAWTKIRVQNLVLGLLDVYNTCLFNVGMKWAVDAERIQTMTNGIVAWKAIFIQKGLLPKQTEWDTVPREQEDPTAAVKAQIDDYSDDEEATDTRAPVLGRHRSEAAARKAAPARSDLELGERANYTADASEHAARVW